MFKNIIILLLIFNYSYSQEWLIVSIINQNSKGIKYEVDNGEKVSKKSTKNPSLVKLILDFRQMGYDLNNITQVNQIDLNGVFPLFNNNANFNFQTTNLNLNNNLRTNLWFRKETKEE
tara:strand:- start:331 stop:684 length:354 start_codon:yes stop_codon:yes gene_type:complete